MAKLKGKRAVLVVGATGRIGSCLTRQLLDNTDYLVTILVRNEDVARALFDAELRSGRVRLCLTKQLAADDLLHAMDGVDVVVWCVGPKSRSRLVDLVSSSPDSSKSVDFLAVQQLRDAVTQSTTLQRIIVIEPPEVDRPFRLGTILGNLTQNYIYYWKASGESVLKGSGLDYTIIRPHHVQSDRTSMHSSVANLSFHQGAASSWRLKRYAPVPIASLADVICETIDRLDQTRRCTFEVSGDPSHAAVWDDLFGKLQPDHEPAKKSSLVQRHRIAIALGITCSLATAAGVGFALVKYTGYDQQLGRLLLPK